METTLRLSPTLMQCWGRLTGVHHAQKVCAARQSCLKYVNIGQEFLIAGCSKTFLNVISDAAPNVLHVGAISRVTSCNLVHPLRGVLHAEPRLRHQSAYNCFVYIFCVYRTPRFGHCAARPRQCEEPGVGSPKAAMRAGSWQSRTLRTRARRSGGCARRPCRRRGTWCSRWRASWMQPPPGRPPRLLLLLQKSHRLPGRPLCVHTATCVNLSCT
jgi:hypothetical protein